MEYNELPLTVIYIFFFGGETERVGAWEFTSGGKSLNTECNLIMLLM